MKHAPRPARARPARLLLAEPTGRRERPSLIGRAAASIKTRAPARLPGRGGARRAPGAVVARPGRPRPGQGAAPASPPGSGPAGPRRKQQELALNSKKIKKENQKRQQQTNQPHRDRQPALHCIPSATKGMIHSEGILQKSYFKNSLCRKKISLLSHINSKPHNNAAFSMYVILSIPEVRSCCLMFPFFATETVECIKSKAQLSSPSRLLYVDSC